MSTSFKPIKGRAYTFYVGLIDQSNAKLLRVAPTISAADFKVSKDGGAFANLATTPTVTPAGGAAVKIILSATEMTADNVTILCNSVSLQWCDQLISITTKDPSFANFEFVMRDTSGNPKTGLGSAVTVTRSQDGGAFSAGTLGAVSEIANGAYQIAIPLADATYTDSLTLYFTATGCMPTMVTLTPAF